MRRKRWNIFQKNENGEKRQRRCHRGKKRCQIFQKNENCEKLRNRCRRRLLRQKKWRIKKFTKKAVRGTKVDESLNRCRSAINHRFLLARFFIRSRARTNPREDKPLSLADYATLLCYLLSLSYLSPISMHTRAHAHTFRVDSIRANDENFRLARPGESRILKKCI